MNRRRFLLSSGVFMAALGSCAVYWPRRWEYIVIHHSAGSYGTIEFLQEVHRNRQAGDPVDAIPYHYVIGNGNGLGMGEIASDWRREMNIWGTHVSANNKGRNFLGLGICLIGNFEESAPPEPQFEALVTLSRELMGRYEIAPENVGMHGKLQGESTKCPGRLFPYDRFLAAIE